MRTSTLAQRPWHDCNVLRETVSLDGVELTLVDTAGLRDTPDEIEAEGIRRARAELALLIVDAQTTAQYRTRNEARADLFDCLERFHNPRTRRRVARRDRKFQALIKPSAETG